MYMCVVLMMNEVCLCLLFYDECVMMKVMMGVVMMSDDEGVG